LTNIFEFVKSIGAMLRSFTWPASLSVIKLNVIRLSVIKLSVIKLNVVLLSVVAPLKRTASTFSFHFQDLITVSASQVFRGRNKNLKPLKICAGIHNISYDLLAIKSFTE
jgi:hypothetical protein